MENPFDWRISYFRKLINNLSDVLTEVYKTPFINVESTKLIEREKLIENIIGIGFLTSQIYITGTIADAKMFSTEPGKISKKQLLNDYGELLPGKDVTSIALCDAYANYYKHNEEWNGKSLDKLNDNAVKTIRTLNSAGIDVPLMDGRMVEYPVGQIVNLLLATESGINISALLPILSEWRSHVFDSIMNNITRPTRGCS